MFIFLTKPSNSIFYVKIGNNFHPTQDWIAFIWKILSHLTEISHNGPYAGFRPISRNFSYNTGRFICCLYHYYECSPKILNQSINSS